MNTNLPKGWILSGSAPEHFDASLDHETVHSGRASGVLRSLSPQIDGFGTLMQQASPRGYEGKRVRLSAWIKTKDVADWAGLWFRVDGADARILAFDNMGNRPLKGALDWAKYDIVLDVPGEAALFAYGILLAGTGEAWLDDVALEVVGKDVPVTDISNIQPDLEPPTNLGFED
jgi:hypothetical protein